MSLRERRIISAMTPEAEARLARMEAEGLDPITGKPKCEGVNCRCEIKHGKNKSAVVQGGPGKDGATEANGADRGSDSTGGAA